MSRPDVWWDWHAADEAVGALRRIADALDTAATQRARIADELLAGLAGPRKSEWTARHAAIQSEATQLREQCLRAAQAITQVSARARADQDRINRERLAHQQAAKYGGQQ
ncbi:hypothetical protein [Chloroflexus sp.]|uniref:hypothetical protein n=1 Tax=Chloroflexus sp. TaxID=1904827 RepID=UPI0026048A3E|nr:hypothetical protein [uncultured Chloroflexus sp.]